MLLIERRRVCVFNLIDVMSTCMGMSGEGEEERGRRGESRRREAKAAAKAGMKG